MAVNTQSFSTITQNWAAAVQGACNTLLDFGIGSILRAIAQAQAGVALWLQGLILQVLATTRLSTSFGNDVDTFCVDFMPALPGSVTAALPKGSPRVPAIAATGPATVARFTPTNQALIPASVTPGDGLGARVQTLDGTQTFQVIADATQVLYSAALGAYVLPAGQANGSVTVRALVPGTGGNIIAGSLTVLQTGISGVDTVTNPTMYTNGADQESDAALKLRFSLTIQSLSKGTTAAIGAALTAYNGNLQYTIALTPTQQPAVTVAVDDGSGTIPAAILAGAQGAVASVIADGISFAVMAATKLVANVNASITTATGYNHSAVCAAVVTAIDNWIVALGLGNPLDFYSLPAIISAVPGVTGITFLSVNNAQANMTPSATQTIKPGTVTCS